MFTINQNTAIAVSSSTKSGKKSNSIREKIRIARVKNKTKVTISTAKKPSLKSRNLTAKAQRYLNGTMSRREFISEVTYVVLYIPTVFHQYDHDVKYDFYTEVIANLDNIMKYYIPSEHISFENWFIWFLKKRYINFIAARKRHDVCVIEDEISEQTADTQCQQFNCDNVYAYGSLDLSGLSDTECDLVKAKYGIFDKNNESVLAKKSYEQYVSKAKIAETITRKYCILLDIQNKIYRENDPEKLALLKEKEQEVKVYKRRLEKSLHSLRDINSIRNLADYYNMSKNTVAKYIANAEKKIFADNYSVFF